MSDRIARFTEQVVGSVKAYVARAAGDLRKEIQALAFRLDALPTREQMKGEPGLDAVIDETMLQAAAERAVAALPRAKDGEPGRDAVIDFAALQAAAEQVVAKLPKPQDGKSIDREEVRTMLRELVDAIPRPADGKSVDPVVLRAMVEEAVAARVAQLPPAQPGKDGDSVPLETVKALVEGAVAERVAALPKPEPGRDGHDVDMAEVRALMETLFKGIPVPRDGKSADPAEVRQQVEGLVAAALPALVNQVFKDAEEGLVARAAGQVPIIAPQKGERGDDGDPGADGISIEDFDLELKDGRFLVLKLRGADRVIEREIELEGLPQDHGIFQAGRQYPKGAWVTYGGSIWLAKADTAEPPKGPSDAWQLRVKGTR